MGAEPPELPSAPSYVLKPNRDEALSLFNRFFNYALLLPTQGKEDKQYKMKSTTRAVILTTSLLSSSCCAFLATSPTIISQTPSSIISSSPSSHHTRQQHQIIKPSSSQLQMATMTAEELATMSKEEQFEVLGIDDPEKLALGIDPDEVLEFIGTYVGTYIQNHL